MHWSVSGGLGGKKSLMKTCSWQLQLFVNSNRVDLKRYFAGETEHCIKTSMRENCVIYFLFIFGGWRGKWYFFLKPRVVGGPIIWDVPVPVCWRLSCTGLLSVPLSAVVRAAPASMGSPGQQAIKDLSTYWHGWAFRNQAVVLTFTVVQFLSSGNRVLWC